MSDGMNPSGEALNVPNPQTEPVPYRVEGQSVNEVMNELTGAKNTELASGVVAPTITPPASSAPMQPTATPIDITNLAKIDTPMAPAAAATTPVAGTPAIADDADLIEKEWVDKAKQIVERTKTDPHTLNEEIGLYKAEYIKKRFNKDVKTSAEG